MPDFSASSMTQSATAKAERIRRQARRLLREARSEQLSHCLPALRRLQAAGLFAGSRLTALAARRQQVRLKHCLRALAVEYGFPCWEALKPAIGQVPEALLDRDRLYGPGSASLHPWFRSLEEAQTYAGRYGGHAIAVGRHAVVVERGGEHAR